MSGSYASLILCALAFLAGAFLVWVGYVGRKSYRRMVDRETERVPATVVEIRKIVKHSRGASVTHRMPVFRFTVNGMEYTQQSVFSLRDIHELTVGQAEEILCDPADPRHFHRAGDDLDERLGKKLIRIGFFILACCAVWAGVLCFSPGLLP